jgi:hypothetical protein
VRVALGQDQVGVVEQPVDGGGGQGFRHQLVERGGVQVGGDGDGAFLVGGVDEPVQAFGGVLGDWQQADVVDLCGYPHRSIYAEPATMPRLGPCNSQRPGQDALLAVAALLTSA